MRGTGRIDAKIQDKAINILNDFQILLSEFSQTVQLGKSQVLELVTAFEAGYGQVMGATWGQVASDR